MQVNVDPRCSESLARGVPELQHLLIELLTELFPRINPIGLLLLLARPLVVPRPRNLEQSGHTGNAGVCLFLAHQLKALYFRCFDAKEAVAFPRNSLTILSSATSLRNRSRSARSSASRSADGPSPVRSRFFLTHLSSRASPRLSSRATFAIG